MTVELPLPGWPADLPPIREAVPLPGGWVGRTMDAVLTDGRRVVIKQCPYPADAEADGLAALAAAGVPVPAVVTVSGPLLVLERVSGASDWAGLGAAFARMHRVTGPAYGWHRDNHAGRFDQPNGWSHHWPTFFAENRVRTHLADPSIPDDLRRRLERACDGPLQARLPAEPPASLTHGDFWAGNTVDGRWVIDPEVSYADRELDLAYMLMSAKNPLPPEFWDAYAAEWPLPEDFGTRRLVLGLHHRLLQVRHFGDSQLPALDRDLTALGW